MTIDPTLLDEQRRDPLPDDDELLAADPSAAWGALVRLRADAVQTSAPVAPVPDVDAMRRWSEQTTTGDEAVPWYAARSLLVAEMLEATLDERPDDGARTLAAAPAHQAVDPWPARYAGEGWRVVLGVDESGWLYFELEQVPPFTAQQGHLALPDLDLRVRTSLDAGHAGGLGPAVELLGGEDYNPVRSLDLVDEDGSAWSIPLEET